MRNPSLLALVVCVAGCSGNKSEGCSEGAGPTAQAADISTDATWTAAESPHVVTGAVDVTGGATLTIEPCAVVRLAPSAAIVAGSTGGGATGGTIHAVGTSKKPIVFTRDGASPWRSLVANPLGRVELAHVVLEGGGEDDFNGGPSLLARGEGVTPIANVEVRNVTIRASKGAGFNLQALAAFTGDSDALVVTSSGTAAGIITPQAAGTLPAGDYTGNAADEIVLPTAADNVVYESTTWRDRGVPYRVSGITHVLVAPATDGGAPSVLTIEPGVTVRFDPGTSLIIGVGAGGATTRAGVLVADGTPEDPIVFTSALVTATAGSWTGIVFRSMNWDTNVIDNARVEYAGGECLCVVGTCTDTGVGHEGAISMQAEQPASPFVTNTTIRASGLHGIVRAWAADDGGPDFTATNTFTDVPGCRQTYPRDSLNGCPADPPCP